MSRQAEAFTNGWAASEWEHAEGCDYCAKMTALQLDSEHPRAAVLLQHLALFGQHRMMQRHLEVCWSCKLLLRARIVGLVRAWIQTRQWTPAQIGEKLAHVVVGGTTTGTPQVVPQAGFSNRSLPPFHTVWEGNDLQVHVREGEPPARPLILRVDNPNGRWADHSVECELLFGPGDPLRIPVTLRHHPDLGATGESRRERSALVASNRECWKVVAYPTDESISGKDGDRS